MTPDWATFSTDHATEGKGGELTDDAAQLLAEVVERLATVGLPQGQWLVRIEHALAGLATTQTLLMDLRDAIIDEYGEAHDQLLTLAPVPQGEQPDEQARQADG